MKLEVKRDDNLSSLFNKKTQPQYKERLLFEITKIYRAAVARGSTRIH